MVSVLHCAEHNHDLSSPSKRRFFKSSRELPPHVKKRLATNDIAGIRPKKNFNSFVVEAGRHENLTFLEKDVRNFLDNVRHLRLGEADAAAIQKYFLKMQADNSNFFYIMDINEEGRLRNVFWADARSRAAYKEFGDVVTFDTTYLTNKYDMPFAPFVGVNHHGQSILLGCGLISHEDTDTFTWLFQSWLTCMSNHAPSAIITDQDKAMQRAIGIVFPFTRHRWCLWHIMKKIPEKLKGYKEKYESIKFSFQNIVYDSLNCDEFEDRWKVFVEKYNLQNNEWLLGLYEKRRRWVPSFVKDTFWACMSTTQRSESINAFFDEYVNSKTTLKQFVEQYENALRDKVEKQSLADFQSFNSKIPCFTMYNIEKQYHDAYTNAKFKEFQKELEGKMHCGISSSERNGTIIDITVDEDVKIDTEMRRVPFIVHFNEDIQV
ncbi:protein FAR1-RELATED SEQUENCE 5-like [Rosa rugosa]|uniref:protein FAR1-RELATED SEQUENCE 5-like n=1 Tax=Rosa rugosa TaxID=74645 RepID=UPI002B408291|nr:protein FAR1-RELATED SEQUENCE 5-like [Rosa rugosa]